MQVSVSTSFWTRSNTALDSLFYLLFRTIYEKLASAFTEEVAVLYRQRVEEISPNIRYCAYNIGEYRRKFTGSSAKPVWAGSAGSVHGRGARAALLRRPQRCSDQAAHTAFLSKGLRTITPVLTWRPHTCVHACFLLARS